ncbi:CDP-glucose 4,6-dehydratase [Actinomycetota bacterium]|nr:CDP-glucose 4,6-dehydratase [Actinomycetota bacterium]
MSANHDLSFFANKKVLLTGHTGFKGAWLSHILCNAGSQLTGYSLEPSTNPNLFELLGLSKRMDSIIADIRDFDTLSQVIQGTQPEIVLHLAAQPLVRESYENPLYTYQTNVMGTANILEAIRQANSVKSFLNVTTDKVYENKEWEYGYREVDPLDGYDPYSNSKSCSELVTHSYQKSFFAAKDVAISTARAGNVIGGGDFSKDRIIPDCIRDASDGQPIKVRNPHSTRPYQHVLEPLFAYLMIAKEQYNKPELAGWYNIGPNDEDCVTTGDLVDLFCKLWAENASWQNHYDGGPHEANFLKLDCSKLKQQFGWNPQWGIDQAVAKTIEWTKAWILGADVIQVMNQQIAAYLELA